MSDFFLFGKNLEQTCTIFYTLDGIAMLPCLIIFLKANGAMPYGITAVFRNNILRLVNVNDPVAVSIYVLFGFLQLLRPLAVYNLHYVYLHKFKSEPNKLNHLPFLIGVPLVICFFGAALL